MERATETGAFPVRVEQRSAVPLPRSVDALVIGGGVIGLLTAIELRGQGRSVTVLEARNIGNAQSGRNLGFVREQGRVPEEAVAMRYSADRWRTLSERLGDALGWTGGGHLSLARDAAEWERVEAWGTIAAEIGTPFQLLQGDALRQAHPWLGDGLVGAGYTPRDGHVDPATAVHAIADLARAAGVVVLEGVEATEVVRAGNAVTGVRVGDSEITASLVVLAAGVWSARLLARAGARLPLHIGRSTVGLTRPTAPITRSSAWDMSGVGFRQSVDGRVVFGLGAFVDVDVRWEDVRSSISLLPLLWENRRTMRIHLGAPLAHDAGRVMTGHALPPIARDEPRPNPRTVQRGLQYLGELVPELRDAQLETSWAGLMDSTPDFLPIAGESGVENLLIIAGTSGHGMGIAPALADGVAALAESGQAPELLAPFSRTRFRGAAEAG